MVWWGDMLPDLWCYSSTCHTYLLSPDTCNLQEYVGTSQHTVRLKKSVPQQNSTIEGLLRLVAPYLTMCCNTILCQGMSRYYKKHVCVPTLWPSDPTSPSIGANIIKHLSLRRLWLQFSMVLACTERLVEAVGHTVRHQNVSCCTQACLGILCKCKVCCN